MNFGNKSNLELLEITRLLRLEQYKRISSEKTMQEAMDLGIEFDKANSVHAFDSHHYSMLNKFNRYYK